VRSSDAEAAATAFLISIAVSPIVTAACKHFGLLDHPGPLKIHKHPIPRLGGVALAIAIATGMLVAGHFELDRSLVVAGFFLVWVTGLLDDIRPLHPVARLISQTGAAFLLWRAGYGFSGAPSGVLSLLGAIVFVVVFSNSWNFLDGSDGLAAGIAAIVALAFFCAASRPQDSGTAALAAGMAAACGGFLIWNFAPAKLHMGDSGSTLLGFAIAFLTLDFYRSHPASLPVAVFPGFVTALPLLDAALAIIRRLWQARSVVRGDRCHIYDVLLARGWQARTVALVFFVISGVLAGLGWLAVSSNRAIFLLLGAAILAAVLAAAIRLGALGRSENAAPGELHPPQFISSRITR